MSAFRSTLEVYTREQLPQDLGCDPEQPRCRALYPRKNRTKKALWELDNLRRSLHLLNYVDSPQFQRNIQRALNRGESYHKLVRAVAYANGGKLRVRTDQEQQQNHRH